MKALKQIQTSKFYILLLAAPLLAPTLLLAAQYSQMWIADMYVSFSTYIIAATCILIGVAFYTASKRIHYIAIILALVLVVFAAIPSYQWLLDPDTTYIKEGDVRIATFNKLLSNKNYKDMRKELSPENYDVIGLSEVSDEDFSTLKKQWRYSLTAECDCDPARTAELVLLSSYPILKNEVISAGKENGGMLRAVLDVEGEELITYVTHTPSPISNNNFQNRNDMLGMLVPSRIVRDNKKPAVFMGDLNISPYSSHYRKTVRSLIGYKNIMKGSGTLQTWCLLDLATFCAPIDHVFVTNRIGVTKPEIIKIRGSDHKLITTELVIN